MFKKYKRKTYETIVFHRNRKEIRLNNEKSFSVCQGVSFQNVTKTNFETVRVRNFVQNTNEKTSKSFFSVTIVTFPSFLLAPVCRRSEVIKNSRVVLWVQGGIVASRNVRTETLSAILTTRYCVFYRIIGIRSAP